MGSLDYPDRPKASPLGGFFIRSRGGKNGNFEVVFPWPDGGIAHFWRDNDDPAMPWHGPTLFGEGRYQGATIIESDNQAFKSSGLKNFEVIAVAENGDAEHWWRENGGTFRWRKAGVVVSRAAGVPALAYSGARFLSSGFFFDLTGHGPSEFFLAVASEGEGFNFFRHRNDQTVTPGSSPPAWEHISSPPVFSSISKAILSDRKFVGLGLALTTLKNTTTSAGWKEMREGVEFPIVSGNVLVCCGSDQGALHVLEWEYTSATPGQSVSRQLWVDGTTLTLPTPLGHELRPFRGRPSILQSDYGLDEIGEISGFFGDRAEYGNLEVVAPAKAGGLLHFGRDNGDHPNSSKMNDGWSFGAKFGEALYDEVSLMQSRFGSGDNGNLEVVARRHDQRGFDFYWREPDFVWRGPIQIERTAISSVRQPLSVDDILLALGWVRVTFSVPEVDLRSWLANSEFTPYPSISSVLLELLSGHRLKRELDLDVIVFNYEHSPGVQSRRRVADVDRQRLSAAVLEGFNERYGTNETELSAILD
jgi:hypothetical protein